MIAIWLAAVVALAPQPSVSWILVPVPGDGPIASWTSPGPDEVWVLRTGHLFRMHNGEWVEETAPADLSAAAGHMHVSQEGNERIVWLFEGQRAWRKYRGEWESWTLHQAGRMDGLSDFHSIDRGCTSGLWHKIECFDGQTWTVVDDPAVAEWEITYPAGLHVTATQVIATNRNGTTYFHDGETWARKPAPPSVAGMDCSSQRIDEQLFLSCGGVSAFRWTGEGWAEISGEVADNLGVPLAGYHYSSVEGLVIQNRLGPGVDARCPYRVDHRMAFFPDGTAWALADGALARRVEERFPQLVESTVEAGLTGLAETSHAAAWDLNGDDSDDLLVTSGTQPDRLYVSSGNTYLDRTDLLGEESACCPTAKEHMTFADLDGDSLPEIVASRTRSTPRGLTTSKAVYRLVHGGRWRNWVGTRLEADDWEVAEDARFAGNAWLDLDGDGDLDVYQSRFQGPGEFGALNLAHLNDGFGRFELAPYECHRCGGGSLGFSLGAAVANLDDRPGEEILLLSAYGNGNKLYTWREDELWDATRLSGLAGGYSVTAAAEFGDLDGDGDVDAVVINEDHPRVYRNDGELRFTDVTLQALGFVEARGEHVTVALADLDGDGDLDLVLSHAHRQGSVEAGPRVFLGHGDGTFFDGTLSVLGDMPGDFIGVLPFDAHGDGDTDLFLFGPQRNVFLDNRTPDTHWVRVHLVCHGQNTGCSGAILTGRQEGTVVHCAPVAVDQRTIAVPVPDGGTVDLELRLADGRVLALNGVRPGDTRMGDGLGLRGAFDRQVRAVVLRFLWGPPLAQAAKLVLVLIVCLLAYVIVVTRVPSARRRFVLSVPVIVAVALAVDVRAAWLPALLNHGLGPGAAMVMVLILVGVEIGAGNYRRDRYIAHFKILGFLGEGGMGKVYKARDLSNGTIVALKLIKPDILETEHGRQRFLREAEMYLSASQDGVIEIHEKGECQVFYEGTRKTLVYLSMEFVPGLTVGQLMGLHPKKLPLERILRIGARAAEILHGVHRTGVIHRDIKPSNIMVVGDHEVKIMDFGIAKAEAMTSMTETGMLMGTVRYMAPEQFLGTEATPASDLYGLGLVIYLAVAGRLPFGEDIPLPTFIYKIVKTDPPPPSTFNPSLSPVVDAAVMRAIGREPGSRYQDCGEMAQALRYLLDELSPHERSSPCGFRVSSSEFADRGDQDVSVSTRTR